MNSRSLFSRHFTTIQIVSFLISSRLSDSDSGGQTDGAPCFSSKSVKLSASAEEEEEEEGLSRDSREQIVSRPRPQIKEAKAHLHFLPLDEQLGLDSEGWK